MNIIDEKTARPHAVGFIGERAMFSQQVFMQGLGLGASLIMPIGAQNAHVIRTGIRGRHVVLTVAASRPGEDATRAPKPRPDCTKVGI